MTMRLATGDVQDGTGRLLELAQELLDAHCDTVCLADTLAPTPEWVAHVQYLKDIQRVGKRTLAELAANLSEKPRPNPVAGTPGISARLYHEAERAFASRLAISGGSDNSASWRRT